MTLALSEKDIRDMKRGKTKLPCVGCGKPIKNRALDAYLDAIKAGYDNPQPVCYCDSEPNPRCNQQYHSRMKQAEGYSKN